MNNRKYLTYLGFAIKAGQCGMGTYACESQLAVNKTKLLLCSVSASERTRKKFEIMCEEKGIPFRVVEEDLGQATGRNGTNVYSVMNIQLTEAILKDLDANVTWGCED